MRLLAFDTSTDTMSIAVSRVAEGGPRVWHYTGAGGAKASAGLIPLALDLMARAALGFADLDAIVFGRGPGAFTGLRTACSVAQGLGFGAQGAAGGRVVPLLPVDSLLALAEDARHRHAPDGGSVQVLAVLDARMEQVYAGHYVFDGARWQTRLDPLLAHPHELAGAIAALPAGSVVAGNAFAACAGRLVIAAGLFQVDALPSAGALLRLAPALLAAGQGLSPELALPLYIRDKVAQTTAERAAVKAAATSLP